MIIRPQRPGRLAGWAACLLLVCAAPCLAEEPAAPPAPACPVAVREAQPAENASEVLTLEQAQRMALEGNPSLKAVEARVRQAAERVRQARSAYFPQVDASWSATHTGLSDLSVETARTTALYSASRSGGSAGGVSAAISQLRGTLGAVDAYLSVPESVDTYTVQLTASYLLFNGFGRKYSLAAARFGQEQSAAALEEASRLLLESVAQTYYGVQLAGENIRIARADITFNEKLLKDARAKHEAGAGSLSEVLNFEVRMRAAQAALNSAENARSQARIGLAVLLGLGDAQLPETREVAALDPADVPREEPPADTEAIQRATALRPDLRGAELAVRQAESLVGQRRAAYYPVVSTFASRNASRTGTGGFRDEEFSTTLGVNVGYDIFTGGRNRAQVAEARHARTEARHTAEKTRLQILADIRQALEDLQTARKQLALQEENAAFVLRNRDLVVAEYAAGQTSLALLTQAQRDLVEAEGNLVRARVGVAAAWHSLRTATGETLETLEDSAS